MARESTDETMPGFLAMMPRPGDSISMRGTLSRTQASAHTLRTTYITRLAHQAGWQAEARGHEAGRGHGHAVDVHVIGHQPLRQADEPAKNEEIIETE